MGTQVITRDTGRRLGVVGEVVVDIDRREVVALGLRDNPLTRFLPGLPRWMPLERIRQVGDVILVESSDSLAEGFNPERYSKVINCQVITESGQTLGRVLGFSFDIETGELVTLVIGAIGVPLLAEGVLSTWELPVAEVVSSGSDRIIVYEGAEEKLKQLGTGLLEKMGIGGNSWEREERERWRMGPVPAENQLPAGQPSQQEQRLIQPARARAFQPEEEMEYVELEERRQREPLRQRRYLDEEGPREAERPTYLDREGYGEREPSFRDRGVEAGNGSGAPGRPWDREPEREPMRGSWDRDGQESRSWERSREGRPLERDLERGEPERWETGRREPERLEWERETGRRDWDREPERREPVGREWEQETGRRDWAREPERRGSERREPEGQEWEREPIGGSRERGEEDRSRRRRAEGAPQPRRSTGAMENEPVDVEPEILDDPW
jgi:sporulation protein YlmC with PRC-barrel domain